MSFNLLRFGYHPPPRFRFVLATDAAGPYYGVDENGDVVTSTTDASGAEEPIGWRSTQIKWGRSMIYWGLITTLTTSYQFVGDGAKILRHIYCTQGIAGKCTLIIQKRKKIDFTYETFYVGEIDFKSFSDQDTYVKVSADQGGLNALVNANEDKVYEIPMGSDAELVRLDGVALQNTASYTATLTMSSSIGVDARTVSPILSNYFNESDLAHDTRSTNAIDTASEADISQNSYFFEASAAGGVDISFSGGLRVKCVNTNPYTNDGVRVLIVRNRAGVLYETTIYQDTQSTGYDWYQFISNTVQVQVQAGDKLSLVIGVADLDPSYPPGNTQNYFKMRFYFNTVDSSQNASPASMKVVYQFLLPASDDCKTYRYYQVLQKLFAALSGNTATLSMPFLSTASQTALDNRPYHTRLATSEAARGITNTKFKLKLSEIFKDASGRWMLGLGIAGNTATIAPITAFFQDTEIADLGAVVGFEMAPALDLLFSEIKVGDKISDSDKLNGRFEVNHEQTWSLPLPLQEKSRDLSSSFISGMYSIDRIRVKNRGKDTTDTSDDNTVIVLETESDQTNGKYNLYRPQNTSGNSTFGFPFPGIAASAFNLTLRPTYDLLRNRPLLSAICHNVQPQVSSFIKFQTGEREGAVTTNLGSGAVADRADIAVGSLGARPFLPVLFRFSAVVPDNLYALMEATPYGYFSFTWKGKRYKGFVDEITQRIGDNGVISCSLLAHPSTDLTTLIR